MQTFNRDGTPKFKIKHEHPCYIKNDNGNYEAIYQVLNEVKLIDDDITQNHKQNEVKNHGHSQKLDKIKIYPIGHTKERTNGADQHIF